MPRSAGSREGACHDRYFHRCRTAGGGAGGGPLVHRRVVVVAGGPAGPAGVGHSYGGAVITDAAAQADNAVGLVHAAGFALDVGESAEEITGRLPRTPSAGSLRPPTYRTDTGTWAVEVALDPGSFVHTYAQDRPPAAGALMGVAQRPAAMACLTEPARSPTRRLPSWYREVPASRRAAVHGAPRPFPHLPDRRLPRRHRLAADRGRRRRPHRRSGPAGR